MTGGLTPVAASSSAAASIMQLGALVDSLAASDQILFDRIFRYSVADGTIDPPPELMPWIGSHFGSVEDAKRQRVVKTLNRVTGEGALFNPLRARRPIDDPGPIDLAAEIARTEGDPFCDPDRGTPADAFGRVRGAFCRSAANLAKYDGLHGLIIFDRHDPLDFGAAQVADYLQTAERWLAVAHQHDPLARYPIVTWNCLWKAGGSIVHGHAQVALGRDFQYARVEALRQAAERYRAQHGTSYFADLAQIYQRLGLGLRCGRHTVAASLTPIKEREIILWGPSLDDQFCQAVYRVLSCLRDSFRVRSFNLALSLPPLGPTPESWAGFPVLARVVDRGDPTSRTADLGAMELYASSVVASDPFEVAVHLQKLFPKGPTPAP